MYDPSDHDSKYDRYDRDADGDESSYGRERDVSYGRERDDSPYRSRGEEDFMPMTRRDMRDVDRLSDRVLRDTKTFIQKREQKCEPKQTRAEEIGSMVALAFGALGTAYLSQRFRQAGAVVPLGVLAGGLLYGSSYAGVLGGFSEYGKSAAVGAALASGVIWAAGYGSLAAERAHAQAPTTTTAGFGPPQALRSPFGSQEPPQALRSPPQALRSPFGSQAFAPAPAPASAASMNDDDYLNLIMGRAT